MYKALIFVMLLAGCENGHWYAWRCDKGGDECVRGTEAFNNKEDCDVLAKKAQEAQPNVVRFCVRLAAYYGW
jgi:hypothetical protein